MNPRMSLFSDRLLLGDMTGAQTGFPGFPSHSAWQLQNKRSVGVLVAMRLGNMRRIQGQDQATNFSSRGSGPQLDDLQSECLEARNSSSTW